MPTPREVENEVNILTGQAMEEGGSAHAYLCGALAALEWMEGKRANTPWEHFISLQAITVGRRAS